MTTFKGLRIVTIPEGEVVQVLNSDGSMCDYEMVSGKAVQSGDMLYVTDDDYRQLYPATHA